MIGGVLLEAQKQEGAGGQNSPAPMLGVGRYCSYDLNETIGLNFRQRRFGNKSVIFWQMWPKRDSVLPAHFALFSSQTVV
jgi:hypothetical protein